MSQAFSTLYGLIAYEAGELSTDETIELFQELLDTGMVWKFQGSYGREANRMIYEGLIHE